MSKQPMTIKGKTMLQEELKKLKQEERPAVIKAIEVARGHGDLSENADYDAAKERQGFIEARISEIEGALAESEVIDTSEINSDKVLFGAHVKLLDCISDVEKQFQIVGKDEADIKGGKISVFSPLASSIIGKKKGDVAEFSSPKGDNEYEILEISYK